MLAKVKMLSNMSFYASAHIAFLTQQNILTDLREWSFKRNKHIYS